MAEIIQKIPQPELFFGFVAPIGTNISDSIETLKARLKVHGYDALPIKVTAIFPEFAKHLKFFRGRAHDTIEKRYAANIQFGDDLRKHFDDDSFLAACSVKRIISEREKFLAREARPKFPTKVAYILHQFKRREEVELLRSVYGPLFFQVSVFSKKNSRADNLAQKIAHSHNSANIGAFRASAEELIQRDENEAENPHGQRLSEVFHQADFIVNADANAVPVKMQIDRFVDLIFGSNQISPTKSEYGLYIAKSASLRSIDLSRQVGAAIFSKAGEIITLGANEVPKSSGGTYWCDEVYDNRDFKRGGDSNDRRKRELFSEIAPMIKQNCDVEKLFCDARIKNSQFMDALEYGRVIHAEMSAISDAARLGRALKDTVLFCTTFPCHMCAKHIVASGVSEVVYLEPYPKSLASDLHADSIEIDGQSRGPYGEFPAVIFKHFHGVSPRRYRDFFETRSKRKSDDGSFKPWRAGQPQPIVDVPFFSYLGSEYLLVSNLLQPALRKAKIPSNIFACSSKRPAKK